ncbi:MAG: 1-deoxy-D-xylulose-5-phosphate synthase [Deltaproteobacteria bacterium]|nr:1-deoxy-D-xylulose-5-phosphate synthase [Deltaproteobacteria bacterium]
MPVDTSIYPAPEFARVRDSELLLPLKLAFLADMCRFNTLAAVKRAGSGHLGSSLSSLDIVTTLYYAVLNTAAVGLDHPERDIYFSSKGHDVPGLYAVLHSLGLMSDQDLLALRRLAGPCGHPDVSTPGMEFNTGSLGMGIAKAKGAFLARRILGRGGRVFVMTGDGELQEGQIYESLLAAANQEAGLTVVVDHNKVQSDRLVAETSPLGDLPAKFRAFGWRVERIDGHDFHQLLAALGGEAPPDRPRVIIADTIKGRGVAFMEHPLALAQDDGLYRWHSGAPNDEAYARARQAIASRLGKALANLGLEPPQAGEVPPLPRTWPGFSAQSVAQGYGQALTELGGRHLELVVLDADLSLDCRLEDFRAAYPERFLESGIAEQDMVSTAGGLARHGLLPVVNSFASFLTGRAAEHIYNNASEGTRIIYACHYAGLVPAGPGHTHQSVRDAALMGSVPGMAVIHPCHPDEAAQALAWAVEEAPGPVALRLPITPSPRELTLPPGYTLAPGRGAVLAGAGGRAAVLAYGPLMLAQALAAGEELAAEGVELKVINQPWLNRLDRKWLATALAGVELLYILEDHGPQGGLADTLRAELWNDPQFRQTTLRQLAVTGVPAWGDPDEVLAHHGLDAAHLAAAVRRDLGEVG